MKTGSNVIGSKRRTSIASWKRSRASLLLVFRLLRLIVACQIIHVVHGNPHSKPYIPFRTDPYDQPASKSNIADFRSDSSDDHKIDNIGRSPRLYEPDKAVEQKECPLRFSLDVSHRSNNDSPGFGSIDATTQGIFQPPVIYPILPWEGPGRQVLYATHYEHLDMLTPSKGSSLLAGGEEGGSFLHASDVVREGLTEHLEFPLLFESSAFQTNPLIADVNDDGVMDAILTDYNGGLYAIGLQIGDKNQNHGTNHRYFMKAQTPRMYVRRQWLEAMVNETMGIDPYEAEKKVEEEERKAEEERRAARAASVADGETDPKDETDSDRRERYRAHEERPHDPYHSYFEYSYGSGNSNHETILRGVTANVLAQDQEHVEGLEERRNRNHYPKKTEETVVFDSLEEEEKKQKVIYDSAEEEEKNQKVIYDSIEEDEKKQKVVYDSFEEDEKKQKVIYDSAEEDEKNQKIIYDSAEEKVESNHRRLQEIEDKEGDDPGFGDDMILWGGLADDLHRLGDDTIDNVANEERGDEMEGAGSSDGKHEEADGVHVDGVDGNADNFVGGGDDLYPHFDDDYHDYKDFENQYNSYDDFYSGHYNDLHQDYFDDKHYIRLPPHILCTPVVAELPKLYSKNKAETEKLLFLAVSYYFDEDEYEGLFSYKRFENTDHGDETETKRGMYTANAIMVFYFGESPRWGRQEHLDLSADHSAPVNVSMVGSIPMSVDNSKLGAFALSSPTVADIDGDGSFEILMGTSMGFLYVLDARNLYVKDSWPIQLQYAIESRVVVEDVLGDTNLEIFVADVGGNVLCLDPTGKKLWHRNLLRSATGNQLVYDHSDVLGSSPMVLGDVNGDGILDIVILLEIKKPGQKTSYFLFALSAATGKDLTDEGFPINISTKNSNPHDDMTGEDFIHTKLPPPLVVDMHEDQDHVAQYLKRNGTKWSKPKYESNRGDDSTVPHGGTAGGIHIVQPIETYLVLVEGGSGCTQSIEIGEKINSMVQADDIHGTNKLDLVVSTVSGNVITLQSEAPFHPLNVWNNGELQSRTSGAVHGYSASQGIFVHEISRRFRDIFGVYVPVTFEIFDNRPNIENEPDKRSYTVEIKTGTSKLVFIKLFDSPGVYTERLYIPSGPGYYEISVILKTSHGLTYEDAFHLGYNVNYMAGFSMLLWLPLTIATILIFLLGAKNTPNWDDDDFEGSNGKGILGSDRDIPQ